MIIAPPSKNLNFDILQHPNEAVKVLEEQRFNEEELKSRAFPDGDLRETCQGYNDVNGVVISPYYTAKIGEKSPAYAAMKNKFSAANETNTMNVTVEDCNFRKLNSSKNSKLMFETDEFVEVTYK